MTLKEYINGLMKEKQIFDLIGVSSKLLELEALVKYFELIYGVTFEINVKVVERPQGLFYGQSLIDNLLKSKNKNK